MSKLELPKDMSEKIFSMLKPKARPACVLIFEKERDDSNEMITFKADTLSEKERDFIMQLDYTRAWVHDIEYASFLPGFPDKQVHAALMLGFRFQDDASRSRWKSGEDFEMYRDAVHGIA